VESTDNDTWDLATSVGATATMVAAAKAIATTAADPIIEDRFAEPLVRAVGIDFFTRWATGELDATGVDSADAPWGLQQMTDLLAARTRYFDAFFVDATAAGIRQAVILASGLDAGQPTAWIVEGLLAFLPPDAQDRLLDTITDLSADGKPTGDRDLRPTS
jgi:O-methyltransferase involved in polyketide biosynthesis